MDDNRNEDIKMTEFIKLQNEASGKVVREYCQRAQYQNMVMNKLKYQRNVYADIYEWVLRLEMNIISMLEKVTCRIIADGLIQKNLENNANSQRMIMMQEINETYSKITHVMSMIDHFEYEPQQDATHISFDSVHINETNKFDKQSVIDKLLQLQALEQAKFDQHTSARYERDESTIQTKMLAEEIFYYSY